MPEFEELFEKVWWGWRMRGYTDTSSPVTMWMVAGGMIQVNHTGSWRHTLHRTMGQAQQAAVSDVHGILNT